MFFNAKLESYLAYFLHRDPLYIHINSIYKKTHMIRLWISFLPYKDPFSMINALVMYSTLFFWGITKDHLSSHCDYLLAELLDRGWRRSGCFLYKPDMERTCCPSYTIRLKASDFIPSKEQVRVCKKMQRYFS